MTTRTSLRATRMLLSMLAALVGTEAAAQREPTPESQPPSLRSPTLRALTLALTVTRASGAAVGQTMICAGTPANPSHYGQALSRSDGRAEIQNVPPNVEVMITVHAPRGLQSQRLTRRVGTRNETVDVVLPAGTGGPTCQTTGLSKSPPDGLVMSPRLQAPLRSDAGPIARTRRVHLFTHTGSPWNYLLVSGTPTQFRTSQDASFSGAAWRPATVREGSQMTAVPHDIEGGEGRKTVYLQLRSQNGVSEAYSMQIDFLELYECKLEYRRADNALAPMGQPEGNLGTESVTLRRAQSRTFDVSWPSPNEKLRGFGMHLRLARNTGDHPVEVSYGGGVSWQTMTIAPGDGAQFRADMRSVRCP